MNYLIILYITYNDGTAAKKAMYDAESEAAAVAGFHKYLGQYINVSNVHSVMCMAINNLGGVYRNESWTEPTVTTSDDTSSDTSESETTASSST